MELARLKNFTAWLPTPICLSRTDWPKPVPYNILGRYERLPRPT